MELIDKDALIGKIEERMQVLHPTNTHKMQVGEMMDRDVLMWLNALSWVKDLLDTLEVKEVDLKKEINTWYEYGFPNEEELLDYIAETAKHFFELGLKTKQNG